MKNTVQFLSNTFDHSRIAEAQLSLDIDLSMRTLDVDSARVSLSTEDRSKPMFLFTSEHYPLYTHDGMRLLAAPVSDAPSIGAWSQANPLQIYRGGSLMATFYPSSIKKTASDHAEVTLASALGLLSQKSHKGGIYTGQMTAGDLIREICGDIPVYVESTFENVAIYGYLPYVSPSGIYDAARGSAKDNLLQVVFALNAFVHAGADGTLQVKNLSTAVQSNIDRSRIYRNGASVEELPPVTSVTVLEHQYIIGEEDETLFEGVTSAGQVIIFSEPCSNLSATGFTITEIGANYAVVSAGSGTLTGRPYTHITREITRTVTQADTENEMRVEEATLIGITNSSDVANRLADYYAHRKYIVCDAVLGFESSGDVVSIYDPIDKQQVNACIESVAPLIFSNTLKGHLNALIGYTPWQTVQFEDVRVIITSGNSYTFPNDIAAGTSVEAVLIGGGDGGMDGGDGGNGTGNSATKVYRAHETGNVQTDAGVGGDGGIGGAKGAGGRLLRVSLVVDPSDTISCIIGQGGAANGGIGTDTTFGAYTTASGASEDNGYTDPVTGDVYGAAGTDGITGGNGGNGGNASGSDGVNGGDTVNHSGGLGGAGFKSPTTYDDVYVGGSGGSGATGTADGNNGNAGTYTVSGGGTQMYLRSYGVNGKDGADGSAASLYGCGGSGGDGGSGGSGGGAAKLNIKINDVAALSYAYLEATGGTGGKRGKGSAGMQGCIILYFRKPIS